MQAKNREIQEVKNNEDLFKFKNIPTTLGEAGGFDHYLLNTPVNEVYATGLLRLKRELLLALADKESFATKLGGTPDIFEKYQKYALSHEEADWHGLSFVEAMRKQAKIAAREAEKSVIPDKEKFRRELVQMLRSGKTDDMEMVDLEAESGDSWSSKISGFKNLLK